MNNALRTILGVFGIGWNEYLQHVQNPAEDIYREATRRIIIPLALFLGIGIVCNLVGYHGVNFYFALAFTVVAIWISVHPDIVLPVGVIGGAIGGVRKRSLQGIIDGGDDFLKGYAAAVQFILLWGNILFLILAIISFRENWHELFAAMAIGIACALIVDRLKWSGKLFYKTVFLVLAVSGAWIIVSNMIPSALIVKVGFNPDHFTIKGSELKAESILKLHKRNADQKIEDQLSVYEKKVRRGETLTPSEELLIRTSRQGLQEGGVLKGIKEPFLGSERVYTIQSLSGGTICGLEPLQRYRFAVSGEISVIDSDGEVSMKPLNGSAGDPKGEAIPGPHTKLWAFMIGNAIPDDGEFQADGKGCAKVGLNLNASRQTAFRLTSSQQIRITLYTGPRL